MYKVYPDQLPGPASDPPLDVRVGDGGRNAKGEVRMTPGDGAQEIRLAQELQSGLVFTHAPAVSSSSSIAAVVGASAGAEGKKKDPSAGEPRMEGRKQQQEVSGDNDGAYESFRGRSDPGDGEKSIASMYEVGDRLYGQSQFFFFSFPCIHPSIHSSIPSFLSAFVFPMYDLFLLLFFFFFHTQKTPFCVLIIPVM